MVCDIMSAAYSRSHQEACDLIQNLGVGHSIGIVEAWSVDEYAAAAIACSPGMDTDLGRLGRDTMSDFDSIITGDEFDELFVE